VNTIFNAVEIEINHGCNKTCSYCPNSNSKRIETGLMSLDIYQVLITQLESINFKGRISYDFYNEPMLSPDLESFVAIAREHLPEASIELYSNGTLLTLEKYRTLLKAGVSRFIITKHENISAYEFEKTLEQLNDKERAVLEYRGFTELNLTNRGGILKHIRPEVNTTLLPCYLPMNILTVTLKGNVVPCFEDFYQKNQMGNILESHILDIWNSEKYKEFRADLRKGLRHKFEACKACNRLEVLYE
jgi:radical SAM protein with 4Fe4S-binding SPASM domain